MKRGKTSYPNEILLVETWEIGSIQINLSKTFRTSRDQDKKNETPKRRKKYE